MYIYIVTVELVVELGAKYDIITAMANVSISLPFINML